MKKKRRNKSTADATCGNPALEEDQPKLLCLPYVKGLSERIERACKSSLTNLKVVFKSQRTLRSMLTNVKNRPPAEKVKGVVYQVKCSCGSAYIGETGRTLEIRLKEHQRAVKNRQTTNGIAVHANSTHHSILWDSAEVVCRESHWHKRKVQEALIDEVTSHDQPGCARALLL